MQQIETYRKKIDIDEQWILYEQAVKADKNETADTVISESIKRIYIEIFNHYHAIQQLPSIKRDTENLQHAFQIIREFWQEDSLDFQQSTFEKVLDHIIEKCIQLKTEYEYEYQQQC